MLVKRSQFQKSVSDLSQIGVRGLDTESTGLTEKDHLFCITISNLQDRYYFNFQPYPNLDPECILPRDWIKEMYPIFWNPVSCWFIHNAKHDLKYLSFEGLKIRGPIYCTEVGERLFKNNYMKGQYNLAACAKRRGLQKDELVDQYIMENKLYDKIQVPGKKKAVFLKHFDQVPFEIISKRAEGDADLHFQVGTHQIQEIAKQALTERDLQHSIMDVTKNEQRLTPILFQMERWGVKIDKEYTVKALQSEEHLVGQAKREFETSTGIKFSDGRNCLVEAFTKLGERYPTTALGNPSFTEEVLESMTTPVAQMVNKIRKHQKRANTYYSSFLYFADGAGIIHPNWRQGGTETGRMSASDPNLQNVPKEDDEEDRAKEFLVRGCFVPSFEGWPLVSLDYMQQEFRLMVDYAGQTDVIKALLDGADPHDTIKNLVGCTRREAKVLNFGIPYGMGKGKLAGLLGRTPKEAQEFKDAWFGKMPKVQRFFREAAAVGRQRGYVRNWLGRRCYLDDPNFDYILPNHIIQGGCADIIKVAMVQIWDYFQEKKLRTQMNLQVHDELAFNWHPAEYEEVKVIRSIMEKAYTPRNGMFLTCSVDHSFKSWGAFDKVKGEPK